MSCSSLRNRYEVERERGLSFTRAMELYQEVEGSLAAHRLELDELRRNRCGTDQIDHLREHIEDGEELLWELKSLRVH